MDEFNYTWQHVGKTMKDQVVLHGTEVFEFLVADSARTVFVQMRQDSHGAMQGMLSIQRWVSIVGWEQGNERQERHSLLGEARIS